MQSLRSVVARSVRASRPLRCPQSRIAAVLPQIPQSLVGIRVPLTASARAFSATSRFRNDSEATSEQSDKRDLQEAIRDKRVALVTNLPYETPESEIKNKFEKVGEIETIIKSQRNPGQAFVVYRDAEPVDKAVHEFDGCFWNHRRVFVHIPTLKGRKAAVSSTLYLGNLPYDTSDEVLTNILKPLQGVTAVRVAVDKPTGELKGYIHIDFESEDAAVQASNHLENQEISGRALKVDYARTIPRSGARRSSQGTE